MTHSSIFSFASR